MGEAEGLASQGMKPPKDFSIATARVTLMTLADTGLDMDVKSAVSLIAELCAGDERDPVSVTTQAMRGLKRKTVSE
jgi:hypothetical protein